MLRKIFYGVLVVTGVLILSLNAYATPISGGVSDSEIKARSMRDGASGIHFIDLDSKISGDGWITSWSIWAQSFCEGWTYNYDAKKIGLVIFRDTGSGYLVVGKSPLETIGPGASAWDKKYTFSDLGAGIQVKKDDIIGWYYPYQGSTWPDNSNAGGVIAYDKGSSEHNVQWHFVGLGASELNVGAIVAHDWFSNNEGAGRTYSINVSGSTLPIPVPGSLLLLGSGILGLWGGKRLRKV